jgi:hypothetical protein
MKKLFAPVTFLLAFGLSVAQAIKLEEIVLAEDYSEPEITHSFPCSQYSGVIFCTRQLVLEKNCNDTLEIKPTGLSCFGSSGKMVKFATVNIKSRAEDRTQSGVFYYNLEFSANVELAEFVTPNGNKEYQLLVK